MKRLSCGVVAGALASLTVSAPAAAQVMSNPAQWYINNQIYSTRVFNGAVANSMLNRSGTGGKATPNAVGAKAARDVTAFAEAPNSPLPQLLASRAGAGAANAEEARRLFQSFVDLYKQTARKDGFPSNDLAYAFEYFVVNNYQIYHDLVDVPYEKDPRAKRGKDGFERISIMAEKKALQVTMDQERTIYQQFRERLASNADIQKMTNADKQEATELLATMFGVNFSAYMKGLTEDNDALAAQARQMAKEGLEKLLGVPIARIRITHNGLEL